MNKLIQNLINNYSKISLEYIKSDDFEELLKEINNIEDKYYKIYLNIYNSVNEKDKELLQDLVKLSNYDYSRVVEMFYARKR